MTIDHNQLEKKLYFHVSMQFHYILQVYLLCGISVFVLQCAATNHVYLRLLCYVTDVVQFSSGMREYRPLLASSAHYTNTLWMF